jgi:hypothetical protein
MHTTRQRAVRTTEGCCCLAHPAIRTRQAWFAQRFKRAASAARLIFLVIAARANVPAADVGTPPARLEPKLFECRTTIATICSSENATES